MRGGQLGCAAGSWGAQRLCTARDRTARDRGARAAGMRNLFSSNSFSIPILGGGSSIHFEEAAEFAEEMSMEQRREDLERKVRPIFDLRPNSLLMPMITTRLDHCAALRSGFLLQSLW